MFQISSLDVTDKLKFVESVEENFMANKSSKNESSLCLKGVILVVCLMIFFILGIFIGRNMQQEQISVNLPSSKNVIAPKNTSQSSFITAEKQLKITLLNNSRNEQVLQMMNMTEQKEKDALIDKEQQTIQISSSNSETSITIGLCVVVVGIISFAAFKPLKNKINKKKTKKTQIKGKRENNVKTHFKMGQNYYHKKMFSEAIDSFKKIIRVYPKDLKTMRYLSGSYFKLGKFNKSIEWDQKVIQVDPNNVIAYTNIGAALGRLGRYDQAVALNKISFNIDPQNITTLCNMGITLTKMKRYEEAVTYFNKVLKVNPTHKLTSQYLKQLLKIIQRV